MDQPCVGVCRVSDRGKSRGVVQGTWAPLLLWISHVLGYAELVIGESQGEYVFRDLGSSSAVDQP